jgi:hypothetical protein
LRDVEEERHASERRDPARDVRELEQREQDERGSERPVRRRTPILARDKQQLTNPPYQQAWAR